MIDILCIALAAAGFALLAAAMDRHQRDLMGRKLHPGANRRIQTGGASALIASLLLGIMDAGMAVGVIAWFGHLTVGAGLMLTWLCWSTAGKKSLNKNGVKK